MTALPLGLNAYHRPFAQTPRIRLVNRYFEQNPVNQQENSSLISRPGSTLGLMAGLGPIRATFQQPGVFGGDLFFVSGRTLYRYSRAGQLRSFLGDLALGFTPQFAVQSGLDYQRLWLTDGQTLRYYDGGRYGEGVLTLTLGQSPQVLTNQIRVRIGGLYYLFGAAGGNGSIGSPFGVAIGASDSASLLNLYNAINTAPSRHPTVAAVNITSTFLQVRTRDLTETPTATVTTITDLATGNTPSLCNWASPTLLFGLEFLAQVVTPDDVAISGVASSASHIICVRRQSQRCYYVRPGKVTIDPLDFFEAELEPDAINQAINIGDQVWLIGETATEVWYPSGALDLPFSRAAGQAYSRGGILGSAARVDDRIVMIGNDGVLYEISGGLQARSHSGIEELIRLARSDLRS